MFRKSCLAVAIGSVAFAAQAGEVVVYGMAMPFYDHVRTDGATVGVPRDRPSMTPAAAYTGANDPWRDRITVGTSNLGFRGFEELGPQLNVVWQLESGFQIDQNNGPGLGARDSKVGLQHKVFGEIFLGQWDTPYKYISLAMNPLRAGYTFDRTPITGNPGFAVPNTTTQFTRVGAKPDASFDRRQGNSIQYWSPNFAGFTVRLAHSVNEGKDRLTPTGPIISPEVWAASLQYDRGTLSVRYAYEEHRDYFGMSQIGGSAGGTATNSTSKDRGHKLLMLWLIQQTGTRITAMGERLEYHNNDTVVGANNRYKRNAFYGVLEQRFGGGKHSVFIAGGRALSGSCEKQGGVACTTQNLGADYWNAGYIYRFSRRTEGFIAYYHLRNQESAQYSIGPFVNTVNIAPGADITGYGAGLQHFF
jgi:predicted porin